MATANAGAQRIGWKFSTPLQADYLNTFIAGFSTPGLLTRPKITPTTTNYGADIVIKPFSLLIYPEDTIDTSGTLIDENDEKIYQKMVKITTTTDIKLTVTPEIVAIGFKYSFTSSDGSTQSQWYGEAIALDPGDITGGQGKEPFKGIIIATCQNYIGTDNITYFSIKTNGADISDFLLMKEGWNPQKWLSVISPRRVTDGIHYNKLEVRTHNDSYKCYVNGHEGLNQYKNLTYILTTNVESITNPDGTRGFMPANYNVFRMQTGYQPGRTITEMPPVNPVANEVILYLGETNADYIKGHAYRYVNSEWIDVTANMAFQLSEYSNSLPISKTSGGVFALVDASVTNAGGFSTAFTNNLTIKPVQQEEVNIYYDNNTLFIR